MINKENIQKAFDELSSLSLTQTLENATKALEIIHELIMNLGPELSESDINYFKKRYRDLSDAKSYEKNAFRKVYYSVISETCSKLKMIV